MFNLGASAAGATGSITANGAANSYISLAPGGTAAYDGFNLAATTTISVSGGGGLVVSIPFMNVATSGTAATLVKTGTGLLNLDANNTYTGGTTVSAGTLELSVGGATGTLAPGSTVTVQSRRRVAGQRDGPPEL